MSLICYEARQERNERHAERYFRFATEDENVMEREREGEEAERKSGNLPASLRKIKTRTRLI